MAIVRRNRPRRRGLITAPILTALGVAGVTASVANPVPVASTPATTAQPTTAAEFVPEDCSFVSAENWVAKRSVEDAVLCIGVNGEAGMSDDGLEVLEISAGGSIELESSGRHRHRLVITQGRGGLEHDWRIDGRKQAFDEEARQWRDLMLVSLRDMFPGLWEFGFGQGARALRARMPRPPRPPKAPFPPKPLSSESDQEAGTSDRSTDEDIEALRRLINHR